jgi:hypothetical protein
MGQYSKLKYVDIRPIFVPHLDNHPGGVALPDGDNIILVTEKEKNGLMRMKNGKNPCWIIEEA